MGSVLIEVCLPFVRLELARPWLKNLKCVLSPSTYFPALQMRFKKRKKPIPNISPALSTAASWVLFKFLCVSYPTLISEMKSGFCCFCFVARHWLSSLESDDHNSLSVRRLCSTTFLYTWEEREKLCVSFYVCVCVCAFHCHAKDKRACPVPSGAKPAGCRSCFCFVLCSVFSPQHALLWGVFHSLSFPRRPLSRVRFCMCVLYGRDLDVV